MASPCIDVESWLPVVGYEGLYEVSDQGRVRSLRRVVNNSRVVPPKLLEPYSYKSDHYYVGLCNGSGQRRFKVHRLVLEAFVGPCPDGHYALHWNDDRDDNTLGNLRYGTHSDNMRDRVRNGTDPNASRTHCRRGHEFTSENTYWHTEGRRRRCRACDRQRHASKNPRPPSIDQTHCANGHPFNTENTYVWFSNKGQPNRRCRVCNREAQARRKARIKGGLQR